MRARSVSITHEIKGRKKAGELNAAGLNHHKLVTCLFFLVPQKKKKMEKKSHYCYLSSMPVKRRHTKKVTEEEPTTLLAAEIPSKKWRNWWIRTITTLIMIGMFFIILASGYIWSIAMVMIITMLVYREVIQIAYYSARSNLSWFKTMSW
jgi:hypothetical protein